MGITLVDRAIEQCRASQGHLDTSRHLLARSRRVLNRAWWIAGASDVNGNGGRVTTGFLFKTRLQLDYNYSTGVVRRGEFGGHEVTVHISRNF